MENNNINQLYNMLYKFGDISRQLKERRNE